MSETGGNPFRTVIVGCGRMARRHAEAMARAGGFVVAAVADVREEAARALAEELDVRPYGDLDEMLRREKPDVVVVTTPGSAHAEPTIAAAEAGVRGICCEKPMAACLADGRAMVDACGRNGVALIVNHQRRMGPDVVGMRRLILEGAIGEVYLIRGTCGGDMLGDGTHLVNSVRALAGDEEVKWVLGQVHREPPDPSEPKGMGHVPSGGWRYGYPIETGAMATFEFESGLRAELLTGDVRLPGRAYQDYEVFGSEGRLWRPGDAAEPPVLIRDGRAGGWREAPVTGPDEAFSPMVDVCRAFLRTLHDGEPHPLNGESVLKGLEVVMAVHESARTRSKVLLPLEQPAFPLRLMIEADQL